MRKGDRKKRGSNPFGLTYRAPRGDQSGDDIEPLPIVSTEPEMRAMETPFRKLTRAVKEGTATCKMASDYSKGAAFVIAPVHSLFVTGKKVRQGTRNGHEIIHGTPEQKRARWEEMQSLVTSALEKNVCLTHWGACRVVASSAEKKDLKGWSAKSVHRHTTGPRKAAKK